MKRLVTAITILVALVISVVSENIYLKNDYNQLLNNIDEITNSAEYEYDNLSSELHKKWSDSKMILSLFVNKDNMIEIDTLISNLKYAEPCSPELNTSLNTIIILLKDIYSNEFVIKDYKL